MQLPEKAPTFHWSGKAFQLLSDESLSPLIIKCQKEYYPWEKVKYQLLPGAYSNTDLWNALKMLRRQNGQIVRLGQYQFKLSVPIHIQKELHEFDMNYGGAIGIANPINPLDRQQYLISSLMEEAIASSQIEGAVTTRKAAKEMLRQNRRPRNLSEQMILNNYRTINYIRDIIKEPLTEERLLFVHGLMTAKTLDHPEYEGAFRTNDDVRVVDATDGSVMHQPPAVSELKTLMADFYAFFNEDRETEFIHPVVRACILHFLVGFIHPFADGNGRTARALFYWYMLKNRYWLTEYLSISGIILKSKTAYGKAFLHTEHDDLDLTYFINYKMRVIRLAYENLMKYLQHKTEERQAASLFMRNGGISDKQADILQWFNEEPTKVITVRDVAGRFGISAVTARKYLFDLVSLKLLEARKVNKQKQVFLRSDDFDRQVRALSRK